MHALIPARSGSKSIPNKNMAPLGRKPLLQWVIEAGRQAGCDDITVITDDEGGAIANLAAHLDCHIMRRPRILATDSALVIDLLRWVRECTEIDKAVLLQPTSPFVSPADIAACIDSMTGNLYSSAQTVTPVAHNDHADNQRWIAGETVYFVKQDRAQSKAGKSAHYKFGNCVALNLESAHRQNTPFPITSRAILLDNPFRALDVDGPDDLKLAEAILKGGLV